MNKKGIIIRKLGTSDEIEFDTQMSLLKHFGLSPTYSIFRWIERGWFSPKNTDDCYEIWREPEVTEAKLRELEEQLRRVKGIRYGARREKGM